jgi:hypothetical protein
MNVDSIEMFELHFVMPNFSKLLQVSALSSTRTTLVRGDLRSGNNNVACRGHNNLSQPNSSKLPATFSGS